MSSKPSMLRETPASSSQTRSAQQPPDRNQPRYNVNSDRYLPSTTSSSLSNSYEIPTLRNKPLPETPNGAPVKHNRSVSHPFPSIFGGRKLHKKQLDDDFDSSDGGAPKMVDVARSKSGSTNKTTLQGKADRQPQTGKCMTCDSTVRWPQDLKIFRCTTCLTVNDLEPFDDQRTGRKPMTISLDRTRKMIDHCLNEYFESLLKQDLSPTKHEGTRVASTESSQSSTPAFRRPPLESRGVSEPTSHSNLPSKATSLPHSISTTGLGSQQQRSRVHQERSPPNQDRPMNISGSEAQTRESPVAIFRTIESYVAGCFVGCTALNISFFSLHPSDTAYEQKVTVLAPERHNLDSFTIPPPADGNLISELDAKTLLLGDVVENGSWWTGNRNIQHAPVNNAREKSPERWQGLVNVKSPRINWLELAEWYQLLIQAGHDWQQRWNALQPSTSGSVHDRWQAVSFGRLQHEIRESQLHLQRSLLKATENLLKRPRRPLKNAEDCRFLFMLLANPLLYSPSQHTPKSGQSSTPRDVPGHRSHQSGDARTPVPKPTPSASRRSGGLGHHSGIIKRIVGLIANLSNDIHQFLVSWMARFSDGQFQRSVDIIGSFVTYRLSKQQDRGVPQHLNPTDDLVPSFSDSGIRHASELHAALDIRSNNSSKKKQDGKPKLAVYGEDWQVRAAARFMSLLFQANSGHLLRKRDLAITQDQRFRSAGLNAKYQAYSHGQIVPISAFYNSMLDHADLVADFEAWETTKTKFTFCQYPFFLSIWAKIHILEHDARRQMEVRAREAFFDSILSRKAVSQYLVLKVRRDCLVEDSLKSVSEVVGSGTDDIKKGLRIDFVGEEGIDAGGLRKEWFLSLVREIFDPHHGLFLHDDDSQYCYFNPYCFESSEQFFLVGVLLGLAIYNSTILDVAFPPFVFKKLLASAPATADKLTSTPKVTTNYTLEDLAEFRPVLAKGLRQLLEYDGDVQETFCRDFVIEMDKYGEVVQIPLCTNGRTRPVTNSNRREFVDLYVRYLLDTAVVRQYEPFKRGFFTVCGGNALSLFRPEEIELLIRGSDEPLDVPSLKAVATYENWPKVDVPPERQALVVWFWECFERATPADQRKLLGFITGSDRIPAMGATSLSIKLQLLKDASAEANGYSTERFPIARTCFNTLGLYRYQTRAVLESKLWQAVHESEGFGLK